MSSTIFNSVDNHWRQYSWIPVEMKSDYSGAWPLWKPYYEYGSVATVVRVDNCSYSRSRAVSVRRE